VAKLRERKIEVVMLTGDNAATAKRIAGDLASTAVISQIGSSRSQRPGAPESVPQIGFHVR
jgi:magnesium-transporting ATPase (P-type)